MVENKLSLIKKRTKGFGQLIPLLKTGLMNFENRYMPLSNYSEEEKQSES